MEIKLFKYIRWLFILSLIFLPFNRIQPFLRPKVVAAMMAGELAIYPLIIIFILSLYYRFKFKEPFIKEKLFLQYSLLFIFITIITTVIGLYNYPFYAPSIIEANKYLPELSIPIQVSELCKNFNIEIFTIDQLLLGFIIAKTIFAATVRYIWTFGIVYLLFNWYYCHVDDLKKDIGRGVIGVVILVLLVGVIEALHFMQFPGASDLLASITQFAYMIGEDQNGSWPPLFWEYQFRSIMPEPSYLGMLLTFIMPMLWYMRLRVKTIWIYSLLFGSTILLFLTQSRTAIIVYSGEIIVFIFIWAIISLKIKHILSSWRDLVRVIVVSGLSLIIAVLFISGFMTPPVENFSRVNGIGSYIENNVASVSKVNGKSEQSVSQKEQRSSNMSRSENMKTEFYIFLDHPIVGVGTGLSGMFKPQYLQLNKMNDELERWSREQQKFGIIKSYFPTANQYTLLLAERGIVGFAVYMLPILLILLMLIKAIWKSNGEDMFLIYSLMAYVGYIAVGLTTSLNGTYIFWMVMMIAAVVAYSYLNPKLKGGNKYGN